MEFDNTVADETSVEPEPITIRRLDKIETTHTSNSQGQ
jgi:hypothetical protein